MTHEPLIPGMAKGELRASVVAWIAVAAIAAVVFIGIMALIGPAFPLPAALFVSFVGTVGAVALMGALVDRR